MDMVCRVQSQSGWRYWVVLVGKRGCLNVHERYYNTADGRANLRRENVAEKGARHHNRLGARASGAHPSGDPPASLPSPPFHLILNIYSDPDRVCIHPSERISTPQPRASWLPPPSLSSSARTPNSLPNPNPARSAKPLTTPTSSCAASVHGYANAQETKLAPCAPNRERVPCSRHKRKSRRAGSACTAAIRHAPRMSFG